MKPDLDAIRARYLGEDTLAPPGWFLNGKPPPKWRGRRWIDDDGGARREDWCPDCKDKDK